MPLKYSSNLRNNRSLVQLLLEGRPSNKVQAIIGFSVFAISVVIIQTLGVLIASSAYYDNLNKAPYAPPGLAFAPIWTFIWICTGVAAYLAWSKAGFQKAGSALTFWYLHLFGNIIWTIIFFKLQNLELATFWIAMLQAIVIVSVIGLWQVRPLSGALMTPLLGWLVFATIITADISRFN